MFKKSFGVLLITFACVTFFLVGCEDKPQPFQIMHENVAKICLYKREKQNQVVQIPLIVNCKIDDFMVQEIIGENVDDAHIGIDCGLCTQSDSCYTYIISLLFDWKSYKYRECAVTIDALKVNVNHSEYQYSFGKIEILNETAENNEDAILFGSLGTGYEQMNFLKFDLEFQETVELLSIDTTLDLPITNAEEYLKTYQLDTRTEFMLDVNDSAYKQLYYAFDVSIRYLLDGQEHVFYFTQMPVQTSIENRLPFFLEQST